MVNYGNVFAIQLKSYNCLFMGNFGVVEQQVAGGFIETEGKITHIAAYRRNTVWWNRVVVYGRNKHFMIIGQGALEHIVAMHYRYIPDIMIHDKGRICSRVG
jgi:hypothetical protein